MGFFFKCHPDFQRFTLHHQDLDFLSNQSKFTEGFLLKALETEPIFKIVCLFLLLLDFYLLFGKTRLFLDISGNENKAYRYVKKTRRFYSWPRIKNTDVLLWNTRYHCAFDWHLSLLLHLYKLLQMENLELFQGIIVAM